MNLLLLLLLVVLLLLRDRHHADRVDHDGGRAAAVLHVAVAEHGRVYVAEVRAEAAQVARRVQHVLVKLEVEQIERVDIAEVAARVAAGDVVKLGLDVRVDHVLQGHAQKVGFVTEALEGSCAVAEVKRRIVIHVSDEVVGLIQIKDFLGHPNKETNVYSAKAGKNTKKLPQL